MSTAAPTDLDALFRDRRLNAVLAWLFAVVAGATTPAALVRGQFATALFGVVVVSVILLPPAYFRSRTVMLPWEVVAMTALPSLVRALSTWGPAVQVSQYLAVAAVALMIAVELHAFTSVSMNYGFATLFVVVTTIAAAGVWAVLRWAVAGEAFVASEAALMWEFVNSTAAGLLAGGLFRLYYRRTAFVGRIPAELLTDPTPHDPEAATTADLGLDPDLDADANADASANANPEADGGVSAARVRAARSAAGGLLGTVGSWLSLSAYHQQVVVRAMEYSLVGLLFVGLERGNTGIVVNAAVAFAVVQLPPVLRRDYGVPVNPGIVLWVTSAAFLHALGTVGVPGGRSFYQSVWWYDHLTHSLSASVVAAVGYATVRGIDQHSVAVNLPSRFVFVFILSFTMAFGVLWEVLEFAIGGLGVLTQYGLEDTMLDLVFDMGGAVVVATWGAAYLSDLAGAIGRRLTARRSQ